jgi:signal-transduction protein with cAMP-binding, CBS, and nucleotidyltransferase domain
MSRLPTVREFMDRHVQTISPESDIMGAVDFLLEKRVTGALVANSKDELVGILTEYDCLRLLTHGDERCEAPKGKVKDFMTSKVQTIPPTMDIYYCAGLFMNVSSRSRSTIPADRRSPGPVAHHCSLSARDTCLNAYSERRASPFVAVVALPRIRTGRFSRVKIAPVHLTCASNRASTSLAMPM